jgi:hypothetical protein
MKDCGSRWTVFVIGACMIVAGGLQAQEKRDGGAPDIKMRGGRPMPPVGGAPWNMQGGGPQGSPLRSLLMSAGNEREITYGSVPFAYRVLNLTDEQTKALEAICKEARTENTALYKARPDMSGMSQADAKSFYDETQKKREALAQTYAARANEVLTAEQREEIKKIRELGVQKAAEDKAAQEALKNQMQKIQETYEKKLDAILTPEQKKKLEELAKPTPPTMSVKPPPAALQPAIPARVTPQPVAPAPVPEAKPVPAEGAKIE